MVERKRKKKRNTKTLHRLLEIEKHEHESGANSFGICCVTVEQREYRLILPYKDNLYQNTY